MIERLSGKQSGFSLVEILVTLVIVLIGLLGLAGVQMRAHQAEMESYQRAQALVLVNDMVDRINANRKDHNCYGYTTDSGNTLGTGHAGAAACVKSIISANTKARADADLEAWNLLLQGAAETIGGAGVGAMLGARGCITRISADPIIYKVAVAWQGIAPTIKPTEADPLATCAENLYNTDGTDNLRREVSTTVRIADLS
jgi:type IV pilus assembly protein PilV